MVDVFDVVEFLTTLADRIAELLDASAAGVVLADESGTLRSVASSSEAARLLDLFELQNQEGPCLDCFRSGTPIVNASSPAARPVADVRARGAAARLPVRPRRADAASRAPSSAR